MQRSFHKSLTQSPDGEYRVVVPLGIPDDDGVQLAADGADIEGFVRNPIVTHTGDLTKVVGVAENVEVGDVALTCNIRFARRPAGLPKSEPWEPDRVRALIDQGLISGIEVGYVIVRRRMPSHYERNLGVKVIATAWTMHELSVVALPSGGGRVRPAAMVEQPTDDSAINAAIAVAINSELQRLGVLPAENP